MGSAVISTRGTDEASLRDVWATQESKDTANEWGGDPDAEKKRVINVPKTLKRRREIQSLTASNPISNSNSAGGVPVPDSGISYNPKMENYQKLLDLAVEEERAKLGKEEEDRKLREKYEGVRVGRRIGEDEGEGEERYAGMLLAGGDPDEQEEEEPEEGEQEIMSRKQKRKTQAQRNKAKKLAEKVCHNLSQAAAFNREAEPVIFLLLPSHRNNNYFPPLSRKRNPLTSHPSLVSANQ